MKAKVRTFNGTTSPEVTQRETDHRKLAREAAAEGFVLLENKRTAFTHREVLRLVETVTAEIADRSQSFSMIVGIYALRSIFHNFQIVFLCNFHNLVHLTCNTGIVDRNDRPCFVSDCLFNKIFVNIHRIWSDIYKYDLCTTEHKGISRRNKGIRRHDHFVSRLDIAQKSGHFQRMCTGCRQKHLIDLKTFLHPLGTQLRVFAITAEHSLRNRILNIISFPTSAGLLKSIICLLYSSVIK